MGQPAKTQVQIRDFQGMASNFDPHDVQPGAAVLQVNVMTLRRGELMTRRGLKELVFEDDK